MIKARQDKLLQMMTMMLLATELTITRNSRLLVKNWGSCVPCEAILSSQCLILHSNDLVKFLSLNLCDARWLLVVVIGYVCVVYFHYLDKSAPRLNLLRHWFVHCQGYSRLTADSSVYHKPWTCRRWLEMISLMNQIQLLVLSRWAFIALLGCW